MNELPSPSFNGSADIFSAMKSLAASIPGVSLFEIGQSVMGAPILAAGLGHGKRRIIFTAAHHSDEWLTSLVLIKFLAELLQNEDADLIFAENTLCFVPLVNPDGVDLATGALTQGAHYEHAAKLAEKFPHVPFPYNWKANIQGIDLNLQYPTRWELARELKASAGSSSYAPRDFVGAYPLEAPEAAALAAFTESFSPDLLIALHSQGEVIYYMSNGYCPNGTFPLAEQIAEVSGYELERTPAFSDNAGYKDWFIDKFDRPGFTIEIGNGQNPLPLADFDSVYEKVSPMLHLCATSGQMPQP